MASGVDLESQSSLSPKCAICGTRDAEYEDLICFQCKEDADETTDETTDEDTEDTIGNYPILSY